LIYIYIDELQATVTKFEALSKEYASEKDKKECEGLGAIVEKVKALKATIAPPLATTETQYVDLPFDVSRFGSSENVGGYYRFCSL